MRSWLVFIEGSPILADGTWPVSRLEPDVLRRQPEFGAAEDKGGALRVVAGMRSHRMDVAPGALDRVVEKDRAAAACFEQAVDGFDTPIDGFPAIPTIA